MSGPSLSAIQPGSGVPQVSSATHKVKANWISAIAQPCARCRGKTNKVHPYCRLAIMSMHTTPRVRWRQRTLLRCRLSDLGASIVVIAEPSGYLSPGTVTAGIGPLLFNALGHVARYGTRAARRAPGLSFDEGEGHFDVEFASGLVRRAGHGWAALQLHDTVCYGCFEAAPMGRPQVFGDDQVEILTERLRGAVAEQGCGGMVPAPDRPRVVRIDDGISDLLEDRFGQGRRVFHELFVSLDL